MFARARAVMSPLSKQLMEEEWPEAKLSQLRISVCLQNIFGLFIFVGFFGFGFAVFFVVVFVFWGADCDIVAGEMQIAILEVKQGGQKSLKKVCQVLT